MKGETLVVADISHYVCRWEEGWERAGVPKEARENPVERVKLRFLK